MESLLPAKPSSAGRARRFVVAALHAERCEAEAEVAELLVSELVTNALLHARSEVRVRVAAEQARVRVEVRDESCAPVERRSFSPEAATGRGLALVEALAARWGSDVRPEGKTVWFELDRAAS